MARTKREREERRRKVQKLRLMKSYNVKEIASKLGVHWQTIYSDIKALDARYEKLVSENPSYLKKQLSLIFKFIDEFDFLKREYWRILEDDNLTPEHKRRMLDSIRSATLDKAKILKLIGTGAGDKYLQQNYIHIDAINAKIEPLVQHFVFIIQKFVVKEKQKEALLLLKNYADNMEGSKDAIR